MDVNEPNEVREYFPACSTVLSGGLTITLEHRIVEDLGWVPVAPAVEQTDPPLGPKIHLRFRFAPMGLGPPPVAIEPPARKARDPIDGPAERPRTRRRVKRTPPLRDSDNERTDDP